MLLIIILHVVEIILTASRQRKPVVSRWRTRRAVALSDVQGGLMMDAANNTT